MVGSDPEASYERFFAEAKRSLMSQAYLLVGDFEESQDFVQEVLLRAWRDWPKISSYEDPKGWARRVLHNLVIGNWRATKGRTTVAMPADIGAPAPGVGHLDIVAALQRLPLAQRRALILHDVVGLTVSEVADELDAREGTVRSWLSRGRAVLAASLGLERARTTGEAGSHD